MTMGRFWRRTVMLLAGAILAMMLVSVGLARAGGEDAGTTAGNFLARGAGARTLAMGGAVLGLGGDLGALGWNTAALGWTGESEVVLSHAGLANQSFQEWGAIGGRIGRSQTRWALTGHYQGDGTFEGRDASGASTGSFSASSMAVGAALAQQFGGVATVGLGVKSVHEKLGSVTGSGLAFDAGLMVRSGMLGFGIAAQNVGGEMRYEGASYPLPGNGGAGISFRHPASGVSLALDANFPSAYFNDVRAGIEWQYQGMLALRAGYRHLLGVANDPLSGPSFGVGAGHQGMWLDYGYLVPGHGPSEHRLGLRFGLGGLGDPFGQKDMPREFGAGGGSFIGPPAPGPRR